MARVAVFASGRGSNFEALLRAELDGRLGNASIAMLACDRAGAPALEIARRHGISTCQMSYKGRAREEVEAEVTRALAGAGIEWVALAGFMRLVGPTLLGSFPWRVVNIHPSLLPAFPGLEAVAACLRSGAEASGCTTHFVDEGIDTGPIIGQRVVEVRADDTEATLAARVLEREHELYAWTLRELTTRSWELANGRLAWADGGGAGDGSSSNLAGGDEREAASRAMAKP